MYYLSFYRIKSNHCSLMPGVKLIVLKLENEAKQSIKNLVYLYVTSGHTRKEQNGIPKCFKMFIDGHKLRFKHPLNSIECSKLLVNGNNYDHTSKRYSPTLLLIF